MNRDKERSFHVVASSPNKSLRKLTFVTESNNKKVEEMRRSLYAHHRRDAAGPVGDVRSLYVSLRR